MAQKKITELQLRDDVDDDLNFPSDDTIQSYRVTGAQIWEYIAGRAPSQDEIGNVSLATSVGSSALTIALKTKAGNNPSSGDKARVAFRSATLTTGSHVVREISGALSIVLSSGSTLGQVSAQPSYIWVYLIDNAGTPELAVSHSLYTDDALVTTTAEGGAGAADSATAIYSTTARTDVALRCIGYILNTQSTAGTWASAGTKIQLLQSKRWLAPTVQTFTSGSGTYITPAGCTRIRVRLVGSGGGGAGSGTATPTSGGDGNPTTFGSSLLTGNGGQGGAWGDGTTGGAGGTATIAAPAIGFAIKGSAGNGDNGAGLTFKAGGIGGTSPFGGNGASTRSSGQKSAIANSGSGGGGGYTTSSGSGGGGGGSGGYVDAWIYTPLASYAYAIGAAGTAGTVGGGGGTGGGTGGSGFIIVEEFYD